MKTSNYLVFLGALVAASCTDFDDPDPQVDMAQSTQKHLLDEVVGVSLDIPNEWYKIEDPVLFEDSYGFFLYTLADSEDSEEISVHSEDPVAHIALVFAAQANQLEGLVDEKMKQYKEFNPVRKEVTLGNGEKGIAILGLPGTKEYSVVYTVANDKVYELGFWSEHPGLDKKAYSILNNIQLSQPRKATESLNLKPASEALFRQPPPEVSVRNANAVAERKALALQAIQAGELRTGPEEVTQAPIASRKGSCGFTAPATLYWQLQWDGTNTFYNGSWYNLRNNPGWSAMSGNYGSWWGTNYHVGLCYTDRLNQYYTNDWPIYYWENAYSAFSGYVEWAAWGTDGYKSLGRYVVVRNGKYRSLTAHLSGINVRLGQWIDSYWDVIGWGGDSGEYYANTNWAPHLHAGVNWDASLTYNGQPYGGQSVRPNRLRCFTCKDYDLAASGAGGYYTNFYHGRWMKY